jgi:hypothetical protein
LKTKLVALTLIAFVCWLVPIKILAQETDNSLKQNPQIVALHQDSYKSDDITIKDNAIVRTTPQPNTPAEPRIRPNVVSSEVSGLVDIRRDYSGKNYSKEEVQSLIRDYSAQYGISADLPLRVALAESGYNQFSKNRNSSACGVFQYINSTWIHTEAGKEGISCYDADANVHMAIKSIASGGISNWNASKSAWNR